MEWVIVLVGTFLAMAMGSGVVKLFQGRKRAAGLVSPSGSKVQRRAQRVATRLFVEKDLSGGPRAGGINRNPADVVLTERELIVSTGAGAVLIIDGARPGTAKATGPKRLIVEGRHPLRDVNVRAELLVEEPEAWAAGVAAL